MMRPGCHWLASGPLLALLVTTSACGGQTRSAAAVCHVLATKGVALRDRYENDAASVATDPLPTLVDLVLVPQQFSDLMNEMAAVAPMPIESDFTSLAQYFQAISKSEPGSVSDPLGTLGANVIRSIRVAEPYSRVNSYLTDNCFTHGSTTTP